ncbi:ABC transporter ATP-binding protein [Bryobacterales bacterium F-183]|nr:ABC transporter ATP-binding protein [Bryobacterales bacterium F-183]
MRNLIEIRNLSKVYGEGSAAVKALDGISLDVHQGEMIMMLGPSGSGKTTLLSVMGGILRPTSGSVKVNGIEISNLNETKLPKVRLDNIGFIFQGFNLFPALTTLENVEIAIELRGRAIPKSRARELLEAVGLGDKLNAYPANLSGGQKQRVAIARALAGNPPIILADEPTAALDSTSGQIVMDLLSNLARQQGRAVVIVTHDARVLHYGDRTVHIADGRMTDNHHMPEAA